MPKKPLISVVTTLYDDYRYLKETIDSILNQTLDDFELIIVVEKSDNQNKINELLNDYHDSRIKIINNNKRLGLVKSLNIGLDAVKGEYIARIDCDDICVKDRFEHQIDYLKEHEDVGILGGAIEMFQGASGKYFLPLNNEELRVMSLFDCPLMQPTVMIRTSMLNKYKLRYEDNYYAEDYELWSRAIGYLKIANLNEVLVKYRIHDNNRTLDHDKLFISHQKIIDNQLIKFLDLKLSSSEIKAFNIKISKKNLFRQMLILRKIYLKNKKVHFYDDKILKRYVINRIKQIIKNILNIK